VRYTACRVDVRNRRCFERDGHDGGPPVMHGATAQIFSGPDGTTGLVILASSWRRI
jgi:hypothetical protein